MSVFTDLSQSIEHRLKRQGKCSLHDSCPTVKCPAISGLKHPARLLAFTFSTVLGANIRARAAAKSASSAVSPSSAAIQRAVGVAACRAEATASSTDRSGA